MKSVMLLIWVISTVDRETKKLGSYHAVLAIRRSQIYQQQYIWHEPSIVHLTWALTSSL